MTCETENGEKGSNFEIKINKYKKTGNESCSCNSAFAFVVLFKILFFSSIQFYSASAGLAG